MMARTVPTGFNEPDAREKLLVAVELPISEAGMVPVGACPGIPRCAAPRQSEVGTLHHEFRVRESIMVTTVVRVEVRANDGVYIGRMEI